MDGEATVVASVIDDESHLKTTLRLNRLLEEENQRLKARVASLESVQVLVFGSSTRLGVAMVSSSDSAGTHEMATALMAFDVHKDKLKEKGIGFEVIKGVQVNEFSSDPFK